MEKKRHGKGFIYFICLVSAMGGLLFGYDWVVIGGAKPFYELFFGIAGSPSSQGLAMSIALVGCMAGAMACGWLADKMGRKKLLIVSAVIFLASSFATGGASGFAGFLAARFFGGIGIGVASGLSPMYIAEVAPSEYRGRLVSLNQMMIVIGILGAQIVNWQIADPIPAGFSPEEIAASWNGRMAWRWMFWAPMIPSGIFFILGWFIPESPKWLAMKGRILSGAVAAEASRGSLRGLPASPDADGGAQGEPEQARPSSRLALLFGGKYNKVVWLGIFIAFFQQWCGTNVIFNYAQEIFQSAGYAVGDVLFNIVITGIANVVFTVAAIMTVDKLGRRKLMLGGAGGLCIIYFIMGTCYRFHVTGMLTVVLVVLAIACYAMTLGPCTWVLISELFPTPVRAVAVAVCTFALWAGSSTLTYTFPLFNTAMGAYGTFWLYSAVCLTGFGVFYKYLDETKGKKLE